MESPTFAAVGPVVETDGAASAVVMWRILWSVVTVRPAPS
jgi:hypothetical protein